MPNLDGNLGLDFTARDLTGPAFQQLAGNLDRVARQTEDMRQSLERLPGSMTGAVAGGELLGRVIGDLSKEFIAFHNRAIENARGFGEIAERLRIGVEHYQALRLASISTGTSTDAMQSSLARLNITVGAAEQGNRQAINAFQQLGVKILDVHGQARPLVDIMAEAARGLGQMQDASLRAKIELQLFGEHGPAIEGMLRKLAGGADAMTDSFRRAGLIIDAETIETLKRLQSHSDMSKARLEAMYAVVAAPIQARALTFINEQLANLLERAQKAKLTLADLMAIVGNPTGAAGYIAGRLMPHDVGAELDKQIEAKQKEIDSLDKRIASPRQGDAGKARLETARAEVVAQRDSLQTRRQALDVSRQAAMVDDEAAARGNRGLLPGDTFESGGAGNPTPKGGGSKGEKRDRIGEAIDRLQGQKAAADRALAQMVAGSALPLDELKRHVELQKKIDDELAKLGSYNKNDPRIAQLKASVEERQKAEEAYKRHSAAVEYADQVERKYGDGQVALEETKRRLNESLATGRLGYEAYTIAVREAEFAAKQQTLAMEGQRGGLEGMAAGFQAAANAYEKQNNAFATGGRVFQSTSDLMSNAFTKWRKSGQLDMQEFLASWVDMLAQMAMKAAAAQAFSAITGMIGGGGGLGGFLDGLFGSAGGSAGGNVAGSGMGGAFPSPYADGGRPDVGGLSLVGEKGPELFVPDTAGTVIPAGRTRDLVEGGTGGVTIHQEINISTGVSQTVRAEIATLMPAIKQAAVDGVQQARQRGGAFAADFRR